MAKDLYEALLNMTFDEEEKTAEEIMLEANSIVDDIDSDKLLKFAEKIGMLSFDIDGEEKTADEETNLEALVIGAPADDEEVVVEDETGEEVPVEGEGEVAEGEEEVVEPAGDEVPAEGEDEVVEPVIESEAAEKEDSKADAKEDAKEEAKKDAPVKEKEKEDSKADAKEDAKEEVSKEAFTVTSEELEILAYEILDEKLASLGIDSAGYIGRYVQDEVMCKQLVEKCEKIAAVYELPMTKVADDLIHSIVEKTAAAE